MIAERNPRYALAGNRQRGQAALVAVLLILGVGITVFVYALPTPAKISIENDKKTAAALAQAKEGLIGRATADSNRPGSLPCPDTDNDGSAEIFTGFPFNDCPNYIGRLPWRTLGLPDLRDGNGERLWYALTPSFRDYAAGGVLNSDTPGQITITGTAPASGVIAVVFSPGPVVGTQVRDAANQINVANYLEGGNETGIATSTFVTAATTSAFNDRLLAVTSADLMTLVEKRVAGELLKLLKAYKVDSTSSCGGGCYPWADDDFNGTSNDVSNATRGGVPVKSLRPNYGPPFPAWLDNNQWWRVIYYAVAPIFSEGHNAGTLTVNGVPGFEVVLITTGPAGASRPTIASWVEYVDDPENRDANNIFVTPSSTAYARDRLYAIP